MWDLFCSVIDNYGDAGVSWRLARTLRRDHGIPVRLWLDDLRTLSQLAPAVDANAAVQTVEGVEIRAWSEPFPQVEPGVVVIEAFGCRLPETFLAAMAVRRPQPVWLNLEYLSAEDWVRGCHRGPSVHPRLPLHKYFFFPGFEEGTGGLLRERGLIAARRAFQQDAQALATYWQTHGLPLPAPDERRVSLFCYGHAPVGELLDAWRTGSFPVTALVPTGPVVAPIAAYFGCGALRPGECVIRDALRLHVLPFSDQAGYDRLLWACDLNFVRGEDSFVRAQWAARPLVWHIYPQEEGAHQAKLAAFLDRYCAELPAEAAAAQRALHAAWNAVPNAPTVGAAWRQWLAHQDQARAHAVRWAQLRESGPELGSELVKFVQRQVK